MKNMTHYILLIIIILFSEKNVSAGNGVISIVGEFGGYGDRTVHIVTVEKGKRYAIKRPYRDIDSFGGDIDIDLIIRPLGGHDPWFYEYAEFIEFGPVMRKKNRRKR